MGIFRGPNIVRDGLVLALDAGSERSYPGTGTTWSDLSGNGNHFTLDASGITHNANGYFTLADGGASNTSAITTNTTCTLVFWIKTTDVQSLFWKGDDGNDYLGAYRVGSKFYNNNFGTPDFFMDTVDLPNIYDYIRDGNWHMVEFKDVDLSGITQNQFNRYSGYTFGSGAISSIMMYNRNLTPEESTQNYNAQKSRFGL